MCIDPILPRQISWSRICWISGKSQYDAKLKHLAVEKLTWESPIRKGNRKTDVTRCRKARLENNNRRCPRIWGPVLRATLKTLNTMTLWCTGVSGSALNWIPISRERRQLMIGIIFPERPQRLSFARGEGPSLEHRSMPTEWTSHGAALEKHHWFITPLGIMGDRMRASLNPLIHHGTVVLRGYNGGL